MSTSFAEHLQDYQTRFDAMEPEQKIVLTDKDKNLEGYIVVWNTGISQNGPLKGAAKGGTRIRPDLTLDEVAMLARKMALKNAAAGLPLGGAKSGLRGDPDSVNFEEYYKRFVELCKPHFYENGGACGGLGFDIGARPVHAKWAVEVLGSGKSFTGKPLDMGGTDYDREGIAGLGVAVAGKTLLEENGKNTKGAKFAVQGLGAMGAAVVRYFSGYGGVLYALADPVYGGTWRLTTPPPHEFYENIRHRLEENIKTYLSKHAVKISDDCNAVLEEKADILFPCAIQDVITKDNYQKIKAPFISEGANSPINDDVYPLLHQKGVQVVPDFIANPGGIIAAFVEMTSDADNKVNEAKNMTEQKIAENVRECMALAKKHNVTIREAGLFLAYSRIFD